MTQGAFTQGTFRESPSAICSWQPSLCWSGFTFVLANKCSLGEHNRLLSQTIDW